MRDRIGLLFVTVFAVLAVAAGLVIHYVKLDSAQREDEARQQRAEDDATRELLGRLVEETGQIRQTLERTPLPTLDPALEMLQQDVQSAQGMRTAIAEHYMNTGKMPADNASAGLPEPDQYRGRALMTASVQPDGSIELVFDANSGKDGGRIRMIPDVANVNAMGLQWRCETPDYALIKRILPLCDYTP